MTKALLAGIAAAAFVVIAPAVAQNTPSTSPTAVAAPAPARAPMMREHTRDETVAKVREHFAKMDANRDGYITKSEMESIRTQMKAKFAEGRAERIEHRKERAEMRREHTFERVDANNDGSISRAEFDAAHATRMARVDRNGDGLRDRRMAGMMKKMHHGGMPMGGQMFEMADADKDGRVSLQEAQDAAVRHFDMADTNRDGRVSREEMMQRHKQMRTEHHKG